MVVPPIHPSEYRLCLILWEQKAIRSMDLVNLCRQRLSWAKSTTFTVIRNLEKRGVVQNQDGMVTPLFTKEQVQIAKIDQMVDKYFDGSPAQMIAFLIQKLEEQSSNG